MSTLAGSLRRNAATIALVIIIIVTGTILYVQAIATAQLKQEVDNQQHIIQQIKELSVQLNDRAADRTRQINEVDHHLDCIVTFFTQKDRTQKAIADIQTCTIKPVSQVTAPAATPVPVPQPLPVASPAPTSSPRPRPAAINPFTDREILKPFAKLLGLF
jgi:cell fate (sporulation/competence/biofilm development) regulator YlbF (YheA/YmcA/DUF963 family)